MSFFEEGESLSCAALPVFVSDGPATIILIPNAKICLFFDCEINFTAVGFGGFQLDASGSDVIVDGRVVAKWPNPVNANSAISYWLFVVS